MANNITRMSRGAVARPRQQAAPGQQNMVWDGSNWVWDCDDPGWCSGGNGDVPPFPCPPPGWPPPGCPPWYANANSPPWYPGANAGVSFGTTAPANPVRGHFWWDGQTLWMFDGAAWVATGGEAGGGGATYGPIPPTAPPAGALWFDGSDLLIWTGTAWVHASGAATGPTAPPNPTDGMTWWNGSQLMIWDGNAWVPVSQTKSYIQSTAPPSPNPGDTWWDGTQMRIWDGSAWELVGPGATVGPVPTSTLTFQLVEPNVGVAYSGLTATWSIVPVTATPTVDTEHGWNSTTRQYMPNKAGIYLFEVMVIAWAQAGYNMGFTLARNDTGTITNSVDMVASWLGGGGASEVFYATASGTRRMNGTTDFVRLFGLAAGGTANSYIAPGQSPILKATLLP